MPKEIFDREYEFLDRDLLLDFEELTRTTRLFASLGVKKLRITGGEPLLRKGVEDLIGMLAAVKGIDDLTLTTNGSLLERKAEALAAAGLDRVTVSLDSLDEATFQGMNDVGFSVERVLEGIEAAAAAGLGPIKVNTVIKRGVNDEGIVDMAEHFRGTGHVLRFIEFMDVGTTNGWRLTDVVSAKEVVERISERWPVEPIDPDYRGEVANRYRYTDGAGEFGVISSVTSPFCADCTRARVSAEGKIYTCLFATQGFDLREILRSGASDDEVTEALTALWEDRTDRYSEIRSEATLPIPKVEMSYIGG
jgi:cyclic pyranopterin phosphate synthase